MQIYSQILNKIKEYETIIIHGHVRPDGDCIGSQLGLREALRINFPEKKIYAVGPKAMYVAFLGDLDEISDDTYNNALAICVDCANSERLADQRFKLAKEIIKIDHHIPVDNYGDVELVEEEKPACAQIIFEMLEGLNLKINKDVAIPLYTAIVTDTGRYRFDSVTSETFIVAAKLLEYGVNIAEIDNYLSVESLDVLKFKGYVLSHFKLTKDGFAYIKITKEIVEKYGISYEDAANQVNVISTIPGYPVWALIIEYPAEIRVRLRSRGPDIDKLANQYGGGGHAKASGCKIDSWDDLNKFVKDANKVVKKYKKDQEKNKSTFIK